MPFKFLLAQFLRGEVWFSAKFLNPYWSEKHTKFFNSAGISSKYSPKNPLKPDATSTRYFGNCVEHIKAYFLIRSLPQYRNQ
jgi:hypothetical protein